MAEGMRRPGRGAGPRMLLWLCCALGAVCEGCTVKTKMGAQLTGA